MIFWIQCTHIQTWACLVEHMQELKKDSDFFFTAVSLFFIYLLPPSGKNFHKPQHNGWESLL